METLFEKTNALFQEAVKLEVVAPSKDIASALTVLGDLEKVLRKKRVAWMATLVAQAGQSSLL